MKKQYKRKGNYNIYRAMFLFEDNKYFIISGNYFDKSLHKQTKKFRKKYYSETTWFDIYNNGKIN